MLRHGKTFRTIYDKNEIIKHDDYAEICLYNISGDEVGRALVDIEDLEKVEDYKWCLDSHGYITNANGGEKKIYLHKLICNGEIIDHISQNKLDNRKSNLRSCTHSQNLMNVSHFSNNKTGFKGVYWITGKGKWRAEITINRKRHHLGYFENFQDAKMARIESELKLFGEYSYLNREDSNEEYNNKEEEHKYV